MTSRVTFSGVKNSNYCFKWQRGNLLYKLVSSTNLGLPVVMPQMTIFECQKDKNMTRVKNKVINVKVVLEFIS
jgi:hypothetical protein